MVCRNETDSQYTFGPIASEYESFRPRYPKQLVDLAFKPLNPSSEDRILEIGSGTGKATSTLAERGYRVHCLEPDNEMMAIARRKLAGYSTITFEQTRFEDWVPIASRFAAVFSAHAFHLIAPTIRYQKAFNALMPEGRLVLTWTMYCEANSRTFQKIAQAHKLHGCSSLLPTAVDRQLIRARERDINESRLFECDHTYEIGWRSLYQPEEYVGFLGTLTGYRALPDHVRARLFLDVMEVFRSGDEVLEMPYVTVTYVAAPIKKQSTTEAL